MKITLIELDSWYLIATHVIRQVCGQTSGGIRVRTEIGQLYYY